MLAPFAGAAYTGTPVAVNARTSEGYNSIQAAITAALPGDTITIAMSEATPPVVYDGDLTIAANGITLCATVALGVCAPTSAPARWQASRATFATPPTLWQGEAMRLDGAVPGPGGSTSFFAGQFQQPSTLLVSQLSALSFDFLLSSGACTGGGLYWVFRIDTNGDAVADKNAHLNIPASACGPVGEWRHIDALAVGTWGLSAFGGPASGATFAQAVTLTGSHPIVSVNFVHDAAPGAMGWIDNQQINGAFFRERVDACADARSPDCVAEDARANTIIDGTILVTGNGVTIKGLTLKNTDVATASSSEFAVDVSGTGVTIVDNHIVGNGPRFVQSTSQSPEFGVQVRGAGFTIARNVVTDWAHSGVILTAGPGLVEDNQVNRNRANALYLANAGSPITIVGNDLTQSTVSNIRVDGRSFILHENKLGLSDATISFFTPSVPLIDARFNDWGAYDRPSILATIKDDPAAGAGAHPVDIDCYYAVDGMTQVCPPTASFTVSPTLTPTRDQVLTFTSTSTAGGRPIASYAWDFVDSTATGATATKAWATAGQRTVKLTVTDNEGGSSSATQLVDVLPGDRAPHIAPIPVREIYEAQAVSVRVFASDPDGDAVTLTAPSLPSGAVFTDHGDNTGWLNWTTTYGQSGIHDIEIQATSNTLTVSAYARVVVHFVAAVKVERVSGAYVQASPGEVITVETRVTNLGPSTDTFSLTVLGDPAYVVNVPQASVTLASNASAVVAYTVTASSTKYSGEFQLRVVSQGNANANRFLTTVVDTPVELVVKMNDTRLSPTGQNVAGSVTARHLDGSPYVGASVTVRVQGSTPTGERFVGSQGVFTTGADGVAWFNFGQSPIDRTPGTHYVKASAPRPGASTATSNEASYRILT